ncbi:ATP-binding protein [Cognatilysobacter bugurensis]|uniref:histidine kinase n=1 Tax=Cognatilysobacter bugurensis TaxID=543356 RepID=A0A918WB84_9GAMM|nr:ATP-binding protein [Lysobacter bugurensis]GHA86571.1 hypothetical protein GCM10007067_25780 [Lysobacter bugurensis]
MVVNDTATDPRTDAAAYAALNIGAFVTVPYFTEGTWTHFFAVTSAHSRTWESTEVELLEAFARLVFSKLERAQAHSAVRESAARFRAMADAVPHIVWVTDAQGQIEFFNRQWTLYTGMSDTPGTIGDFAAAVVHPDDGAALMDRLQAAMASGDTFEAEHRIRGRSGQYRWFLARAEAELDPSNGLPRRWYGATMDIHDRRMVEQALAESDRRKDEFIAMLAHELRNPLAPIATAAQILKRSQHDPSRVTSSAEVIERQVSHLTSLVDDLMDVSRVTRGQVTIERGAVNLHEVASAAIEQVQPLLRERCHELRTALAAGDLVVEGAFNRLVQVVANLLANAAKYTPQGGRITVQVGTEGGQAVIRVTDNGVGISPELLPGIFELFTQAERTADRSQGGLGIGLALVRSLVSLHGGTVEAESGGTGCGSTFTVRLPLAATDANRQSAAVAEACGSRSLRILLVDDNRDAAATLADLLCLLGHDVTTAFDATSALETEASGKWDAYILDIGLPDMTGFELAERLKNVSANRDATFIALTGYGQPHDRVASEAAGFDHHMVKPPDVTKLLSVLEGHTA